MERPAAVVLDGERLDVREVEDAWIQSGVESGSEVVRGFVVRCERGLRFKLQYSEERGWRCEALPGLHAV